VTAALRTPIMSKIEISYRSAGSCRVVHTPSGTAITTELPAEYGGSGASFSATDLLAAALGVCIATNVDVVAERHGLPLDALSLSVDKTLASDPKRLEALAVVVRSAVPVPGDLLARLERAAHHCVVHRSLHPDVRVTIAFEAPAR
jgi:putative redox protein